VKGTWQTTDSGGSGAGGAAAVVVIAIIVAAAAAPLINALAELIRVLAITVAIMAAVALAAAVLGLAARRRRPAPYRAEVLAPYVTPAAPQAVHEHPARLQLEQPREIHLHFHGLSSKDIAAIHSQHGQPTAEQERPR
jgi:hypothetical protein